MHSARNNVQKDVHSHLVTGELSLAIIHWLCLVFSEL